MTATRLATPIALTLALVPLLAPTASSQACQVYWTDSTTPDGTLLKLDLATVSTATVVAGTVHARGIAVDTLNGFVFWMEDDPSTSRLRRSALDGSDPITLLDINAHIGEVVVDAVAGKVYWVQGFGSPGMVRRCDLDGTDVEDLVTSGLGHPVGLALDTAGGKIYWSDLQTSKIQRANVDGSGVEDLVSPTPADVYGIDLDVTTGVMYWTGTGTNTIYRSGLDGSNVTMVLTDLSSPAAVELDLVAGHLYWTQADAGSSPGVYRAELDGSNPQTVHTGPDVPFSLDLTTETSAAPYCTSKPNSLFCTPSIGFSGHPSASGPGAFSITATGVLNGMNGLLFYGTSGPNGLPFQGGALCVSGPVVRTLLQNSAGSAPPVQDCSGTFALDFNPVVQSGGDPNLVVGAVVHAQYWSRDPGDVFGFGSSLTDALEFTLCP